ncbi:hypothetical protein [Sandarakinorhabdus sp.]|uniref:hypothetical protein n=1 Tax=Sandarakinorhabdus sp. TaxID=1916663 RepID=UPI00356AF40D
MTFSTSTLRKTGWSLAAALLLLPAIAMQFSSEMIWGPGDFLAATLILGAVGLALEGAARLYGKVRLAAAGAALAAGFLIWLELAVGIAGPG